MSEPGREAEALDHLAAILDCMPDAALAVDEAGRVVAANDVLVELSGYPRAELIGGGLERLVPAAVRERHREHRQRYALDPCRREMGAAVELALERRDGSSRPVEISLSPYRHGGLQLVVAGIRDISERRAAQHALARSERRYRALFHRNPAGIFRSTPDGRLLDCNDAFARICGYGSAEELRSLRAPDLYFDPADRERFVAELRRAGSLDHYAERLRRRDGDEFWVLTAASLLEEAEHGDVIQGAMVDVTGLRAAEGALRASERRYRELFHHNAAGVFRATIEGHLLECNDACARIFGFDSGAELAGCAWLERCFHGDERARLLEALRAGGELRNVEIRGRRRDGSEVWLLAAAALVREGAAEVIEGTLLDLTERKALEAQLRQAQKMEAVGRLAGGIAHDFNNLMGVILGYTELLLEEPASATGRARLEEIRQASERATGLTRQLLAYSRRQVLQARPVQLDRLVVDFESMLRRVLGEDVRLETAYAHGLWSVSADPTQIEQVLLNLAVNSRDAMPEGGVLRLETANVELDAAFVARNRGSRPGSYACLRVTDNGAGMDAETLAHVFEPFFTTKEPGRGTGLGLATVYGIVKQSDGYITVDSQPGQGTEVAIYLPRSRDAAPPEPARVAVAPSRPGGAETILLVEDARPFRRLVLEILTQAGYRVLEAASPGAALTLAAEFDGTIDLVLTDVVMPEMRGHDLAGVLRASHPELRVVYMSGFSEEVVGAAARGRIHFLQKPFASELLLRTLREALASPP